VSDLTTPEDSGDAIPDNLIQPFQVESMAATGRLVRLGDAVRKVLAAHEYPEPVARLLGEAQVIAALMSGMLKFDGILTLQLKGDGPVSIVVVDVTSDGAMRGYAQYNAEALQAAMDRETGPLQEIPRLMGAGYFALTIDQGQDTNRYQGMVELEGATLADCAHGYLRQSAQLDAVIKIAVGWTEDEDTNSDWRGGGVMLQKQAGSGTQRVDGDNDADIEEAWRRAVVLLGSCTSDELLEQDLHPHDLLYRLFNEDGVRVFEPIALEMHCRCSRDRVANVLTSFPREEISTMKIDGDVVVNCEFCNASYRFDDAAVDVIYAEAEQEQQGSS
jgi:molecular chaperone Hsp33